MRSGERRCLPPRGFLLFGLPSPAPPSLGPALSDRAELLLSELVSIKYSCCCWPNGLGRTCDRSSFALALETLAKPGGAAVVPVRPEECLSSDASSLVLRRLCVTAAGSSSPCLLLSCAVAAGLRWGSLARGQARSKGAIAACVRCFAVCFPLSVCSHWSAVRRWDDGAAS